MAKADYKNQFSKLFDRIDFPDEISVPRFRLFSHKTDIKIEDKKIGERKRGWFSDNSTEADIDGKRFKIKRGLFSSKATAFDSENKVYAKIEAIIFDDMIRTPKIIFGKESFSKPRPSKEMTDIFKTYKSKLHFMADKNLVPIEVTYIRSPFYDSKGNAAFYNTGEKIVYDPKIISTRDAVIAKILLDFYYTVYERGEVIPLSDRST